MTKFQENMKKACLVSKNSNPTASLRAKQLQQGFQRFCQMELTL